MSTAPTAQAIIAQLMLGLGAIGQANVVGLNYSDTTTTASFLLKTEKILTLGQTNVLIDLAALFPGVTTPLWLWIREVTGGTQNGFKVRTANAGNPVQIRAGLPYIAAISTFPTIYVDNVSAVNSTWLEIGVIGS